MLTPGVPAATVLLCRDPTGVHGTGIRTGKVRVIGVKGRNVTLPCVMKETKESTSQVSWQRNTRKTPHNSNFFTVTADDPLVFSGDTSRFVFTGSLQEHIGSLQLISVTVEDEGLYTCIFTLFPSGNVDTKIQLTVIVPPVTSLTHEHLVLGNENVTLATCTAADSKPPVQVKWLTGDLKGVRATISNTSHPNGTTTTVSTLVGVPTQEMNHQLVRCRITYVALSKEETLSFSLQVNCM
ncbi:nectin-1-like [Thalassophryne amazonica]|uniref:nectin-1-like n=1 Tax=Thalassophryne amazonica TaxID=390379 RepID=UPI001471E3C5|nr:nectin-1-like [Thalassophryne amazonica]